MVKPFKFDQTRFSAASSLLPEHQSDFQRLVKLLCFASPFQLLFAEFNHATYRDTLISQLTQVAEQEKIRSSVLKLDAKQHLEFAHIETELIQLAAQHQIIHIVGGEFWFDAQRWLAFNIRREAIAQQVKRRLVFWLDEKSIKQLILNAPDLWAWRGGVLSFITPEQTDMSAPTPVLNHIDNRKLPERSKRIAELQHYLSSHPETPPDMQLTLWDELATLKVQLGLLDEALAIRQEKMLPLCALLNETRSRAITLGRIAGILQARGQLDEALRIRQEEQLPVYEALGDKYARAVTMGRIADIFQARGQLDEALRIRHEEELPVYEALGDQHLRAVTRGKIADILQARGQLDEALRIRQEEELPVFEALGDRRSILVCQTNIASLLLKIDPLQHQAQATSLLRQAHQSAQQIGLPEANAIADYAQRWGIVLEST